MSFISLCEINKVVVPEPGIFFWILASIAEAAAVIPNGARIFFASGTATFVRVRANLLKISPDQIKQLYINWHIIFKWRS